MSGFRMPAQGPVSSGGFKLPPKRFVVDNDVPNLPNLILLGEHLRQLEEKLTKEMLQYPPFMSHQQRIPNTLKAIEEAKDRIYDDRQYAKSLERMMQTSRAYGNMNMAWGKPGEEGLSLIAKASFEALPDQMPYSGNVYDDTTWSVPPLRQLAAAKAKIPKSRANEQAIKDSIERPFNLEG